MNPSLQFFQALPFLQPLGIFLFPLIMAVLFWTIALKGVALWKSARNGHKVWFVVMLIVNTLGLLELVYIIWFAKRKETFVAPAPAPAPTPVLPDV